MKERILRLCKRLNKFTVNELETISEINKDDLLPILNALTSEKKIISKNGNYLYNKATIKKATENKLPLKFQFHSKQDIDFLIRGFCADIESMKVMQIFNLTKHVVNKFNQYFRYLLYESQKAELFKYFEKEPIIGQERKYMNITVYLYLYNNKLFVSDTLLKANNARPHTQTERLTIKKIYLRSFRKVLNRSYTHKFCQHLSEELWKDGKTYEERYFQFNKLLYS